MNRLVHRVVGYRFRATFGRRWGGYLAIVLLIGLVGGIAMGSIAAGRRTQSAYPRFLASTDPTDLTLSTYGISADSAANSYSPKVTNEIARLAQVKRVESWVGVFAAPLEPDGTPNFAAVAQLNLAGSVDGLYFNEDRTTAVAGRMASPDRADEFVTTAVGARLLGLRIGQVVPMGFYEPAQANLPGFGTAKVPPERRVDMKLVGLVVFNNEVAADETDRLPTNVLFTPSLTRSLLDATGTQGTWYGLQLVHGSRDVAAVEQAIVALLPPGSASFFRVTSLGEAKVERAVKPETIAIGVFGAIAALATVLIAIQAISRQLRSGDEDLQVLRALGAGLAATISDGLIGILGAVVLGTLLAGAIAVALSPLAPLGPVRPVYPSRGIAFDWAVLGVGLAVLIGGLGAIAGLLASLGAPHRVARRSRAIAARRSRIVRMATSSGLPAPAVVGARFALEPGRGRTAVPVRSALVGTALAVVMVVATLTFGSGLRTLVSHPALYGWNWSYALNSITAVPPQATALLDHDPNVAAWAGVHNLNVQIDGLNVPALLGDTHAALTPPLLAGHAVDDRDQIVLGAATLAQLHKHIGDTVLVGYGRPNQAPLNIPPMRLVIVGTATMPAVATSATLADHTSMGVGALLSTAIVPAAFLQAITNPDTIFNGPGLVFVRLRKGVSAATGLADMQRIADAGTKAFAADPAGVGDTVQLLGVQHPAEIVNYRSAGSTPALLASGLAAGATLALGLTLAASVRRRRHDLALLKTLGFTKRQLAAAVAWQASIAAVIGVVVGVPLGIALGRQLWTLFARNINAVPQPTVPVMSVILVAVGAVVLANLVATLPRRSAARTPAAQVLRAG
ncbi:MAG: hypothetical protein JWO37_423 [Acidimicrobiales bacterium]|nr:hypothetical protein [Acidimicrobiales bacterium]